MRACGDEREGHVRPVNFEVHNLTAIPVRPIGLRDLDRFAARQFDGRFLGFIALDAFGFTLGTAALLHAAGLRGVDIMEAEFRAVRQASAIAVRPVDGRRRVGRSLRGKGNDAATGCHDERRCDPCRSGELDCHERLLG